MTRTFLECESPAALADDHGHVQRKALYAQDPDGNWLEFVEIF